MIDRAFAVLSIAAVAVLAFLAGGFLVLAQQFPHEPLRQAYAIDAMLEMDGDRRQVSFSASLDGSGQVKVNPGASHVR